MRHRGNQVARRWRRAVVDEARRGDWRADSFVEHFENLEYSLAVAHARRDRVARSDRRRGFRAGTVHLDVPGPT
jgi:hypothetical protein